MARGENFTGNGHTQRPRALVVESDSQIAASIEDTLFSIGHDYDVATNRWDARRMLTQTDYSYVLLDLKIPARPHRSVATTEFSMLLLEDFRKSNGNRHVPTIVMAERDPAYLEMIGELVANGASEFVAIPFPQTGHTLSKAIRRVLKKRQPPVGNGHRCPTAVNGNGKPHPFEGGTMAFFPTRVELCGVKICDGSGLVRTILDALREKNSRSRFVSLSGEELADLTGSAGGPTAVAGAIRNFRNRVKRAMLVEAHVAIDPAADLILNDRQHGYRLSQKITVVERASLTAVGQDRDEHDGVADAVVDSPPLDQLASSEMGDDAPGRWILGELKRNGGIRKHQIVQRTGWSDSTVRRALVQLRDEGKVLFEGSARNGHCRLA